MADKLPMAAYGQYQKATLAVLRVIKARFNNLTAEEAYILASEVIMETAKAFDLLVPGDGK